MAFELWTSADLYAVLADTRKDILRTWWMDNYFPESHYSEKEEIIFGELPAALRRVAPFALPTEQGKPIFVKQGEALKSFKPAYIKAKDAVRPTEFRRMMPSEIINNGAPLTMQQRFDARTAEIVQFHRDAVHRQWELMCARSVQYGRCQFRYRRDDEPGGQGDPVVTLDFGRDPAHTITLAPGADWSDPAHDIRGDILRWRDRMAGALRGGNANQIILGSSVTPYFRSNTGLQKLLDTNFRGSETFRMNTGFTPTLNDPQQPVTFVADLGEGMTVWNYSDSFDNENGTPIPLMDPKSVFMSAPNVGGVKCFGAIYDIEAELKPIDIFLKMSLPTFDPGEQFIMTQSAPLMIPVNINRTLTARVLQ